MVGRGDISVERFIVFIVVELVGGGVFVRRFEILRHIELRPIGALFEHKFEAGNKSFKCSRDSKGRRRKQFAQNHCHQFALPVWQSFKGVAPQVFGNLFVEFFFGLCRIKLLRENVPLCVFYVLQDLLAESAFTQV